MVINGSYTIKMNHDTNNINNKVGIAAVVPESISMNHEVKPNSAIMPYLQ